ncbi:MAG: helix-turn-helix domain-containing protein [Clostridiales bacterium]|nr:helix-turn-helix domain-containing protein [Clostridiales bacterium]
MELKTNIANDLKLSQELLCNIAAAETRINQLNDEIRFLTVDDVAALTGWSKTVVKALFNRQDFPSCDYGKSKIILRQAFLEYFMHPVRRGDKYDNRKEKMI